MSQRSSNASNSKYLKQSVGRPQLNLDPTFVDTLKGKEKEREQEQDDQPWWRFTLDTGTSKAWASHHKEVDLEKRTETIGPSSEFSKRAEELSSHHARTPGWSDPWEPFQMNTANPFDAVHHQFSTGPDELGRDDNDKLSRKTIWKNFTEFLLLSPFAPFWLRFLNLAFTTATLALAARIMQIEHNSNIRGIIGSSTITALVFAPLTLIHIFFALWLEYFGAPIGVWSVGAKSESSR
jgi:hypothetical protein